MNRKNIWGVAGIFAVGLLCCPPGCLGNNSAAAQLPKGTASPSAAKKAKAAEPTKTLLKVTGMT